MTDNRIEKIRAGIEKLKSQLLRGACSSQIAIETRCKEEAYNEVLTLLTMQEEPNITGIKSKHATGKLKECIDNAKKAKLNAMLDESLSKETKESWNERLDKKDFRERYKRITQSESFKKAHEGISIGDIVPIEGEEPVSKELKEASLEYWKHQLDSGEDTLRDAFKAGAKWQFERVNEALLSEVLPCFMHGGEADEVVAKLDEVLNKKK